MLGLVLSLFHRLCLLERYGIKVKHCQLLDFLGWEIRFEDVFSLLRRVDGVLHEQIDCDFHLFNRLLKRFI